MHDRDESLPRSELTPPCLACRSMQRGDLQSPRFRVRNLAYRLWQERGRPLGSPEVDWFQAEQVLGIRSTAVLPLFALGIERWTS
jgi:hypothetical protein